MYDGIFLSASELKGQSHYGPISSSLSLSLSHSPQGKKKKRAGRQQKFESTFHFMEEIWLAFEAEERAKIGDCIGERTKEREREKVPECQYGPLFPSSSVIPERTLTSKRGLA